MHLATLNESRAEKVRQARESLDAHLKELAAQMEQGRSENLVHYLEFCAQFHAYSFGNLMLALAQCPHMTRIAGIRTWNKLGRYVRAGEKGIMILAPIEVTRGVREKQDAPDADPDEETTEEENGRRRRVTLFKPVYVFDVSQTGGEELPLIIHAAGEVSAICPALEKAIRGAGIALEFADHVPGCPGAKGASYKGRVVIREDLAPPNRFRTLAHEFAHEILHWRADKESKTIRETEADAAAFVVCRHFGVDCDTADYLLLYNSEPKILLDRLETIRQTASRIIEAIEGESAEGGSGQ